MVANREKRGFNSFAFLPPNSSLASMGIVPPMAWMGIKPYKKIYELGCIFEDWEKV